MFVKFLCVLGFIGGVFCGSYGYYKGEDSNIPDNGSPFYELPCTAQGGLCLPKDQCPEGKLAPLKGLCPLQQKNGVECCFSVAKSATTCRSRGGECFAKSDNCADNLTFWKATDCEKNEKCCILVN